MKVCKICSKTEKEVSFESQRMQCKKCRSLYQKKIKHAWYQKNKEYARLKTKEWRLLNQEAKKAYRKNEYDLNREGAKEKSRLYRKNNKDKVNHWSRMRQCEKSKRVPIWLTIDEKWLISEIYNLAKLRSECTGFKWHVDHIIPLRGKSVSGLHVPFNLQVIPEAVNKVKRNNFPFELNT